MTHGEKKGGEIRTSRSFHFSSNALHTRARAAILAALLAATAGTLD